MKNNILKYFILLLSVLVILTVYLSTVGIETDKFNNQIKKRISLINKEIDLDLKKIKLILDPFKLKIYAKTVGATVYFSKRPLELESIKTQVSLSSLIKNKISSSNIEVKTKSILLNDLIKFIRATSNKPELFILEKIVKKGHVIIDLSLNIDAKGKLKNDYIIEGLIKDASINFLNRSNIKNINFNFNFQKDNYQFDEINFKTEKVNFISKKLNVKKKKNSFLIDAIVELEESMVKWRHSHARMVERIMGRRIGTGGTSGVDYLDKTSQYRVFKDLWAVRTILVKSDKRPVLINPDFYGFYSEKEA